MKRSSMLRTVWRRDTVGEYGGVVVFNRQHQFHKLLHLQCGFVRLSQGKRHAAMPGA